MCRIDREQKNQKPVNTASLSEESQKVIPQAGWLKKQQEELGQKGYTVNSAIKWTLPEPQPEPVPPLPKDNNP